MIDLLDGNEVTAKAVSLAKVDYVPCFPITPQTDFIRIVSEMAADSKFNGIVELLESEHSVISAAVGSSMVGARTFTTTSSQGILLMNEIMYIASGTRCPIVMANGSRGLSAPITLWPDHNDFLANRDASWIMNITETNQELLDFLIMSFRFAEHEKVQLPALVNMDGYIQSYTREQVDVPSQKIVSKFLPKYRRKIKLDVAAPKSLGLAVMKDYTYFKAQMHSAMQNSFSAMQESFSQWKRLTKREYSFVESFYLDDADVALVGMGATATIMKAAVLSLRKKGIKAGLLKLRTIRPFPEQEIKKALHGIKKIAVIDQNIAPGLGGIMYPEIKGALFGDPKTVSSFVAGLGGNPASKKDFEKIIMKTKKSKKELREWLL